MRVAWLSALILIPICFVRDAAAAENYVTQGKRVMCATTESLREALRAIDTHDRQLMETVQGCRYSIAGVPAELLQDNISMVKIRVGDPSEPDRKEFWVLPDTIKRANAR